MFYVAQAEFARLGANGGEYQLGLGTPWSLDLIGAFLQLNISTADDREEEVKPRRQFVFTVVPVL